MHAHAIFPGSSGKGIRKAEDGVTPHLHLILYKNFITFSRRLIVFANFLLVDWST